MTKKVVSLIFARKNNLKHYFTGNTCKRGHLEKRFTTTRACIECTKINLKRNRKENPLRTKKQKKKDDSKYYLKHKGQILKKAKKYHQKNKDRLKEYYSNWHKENYRKNKETITSRNKEYLRNNKDKIKIRLNKYRRIKRIEDPEFKLIDNLRRRVNQVIRKEKLKKNNSTLELIGCSIKQLKTHLQNLWEPGMSWANYGYDGWHIDHVKPIDFFKKKYNFSSSKIQKECFHFTNLQPLWAKDNFRKSNKLNDERRNYA